MLRCLCVNVVGAWREGQVVKPNCIRLEKDLPGSLRPGRVCERKAEIEKKKGKLLGAGYWLRKS